MRTLLTLALSLAILSPSLALAQDHSSTARVEVFDDPDQVTGTVQSPDGTGITVGRRRVRHTLIVPRVHYLPEMYRSVETL